MPRHSRSCAAASWRCRPDIPSAVPRWTSTAQLYAVSRATLYRLLRGDLDAGRAQELMDEMRAAGLPT